MATSTAKSLRFGLLAAVPLALVLLFETGCLEIPVHVAPKVEGAGGQGTIAEPATIQVGKSSREEVERSWKWCEVPTNLDRLFVCQVKRSASSEISIIMVPLHASRDWEEQYLFVEFDERGIVSQTYFPSNLERALVEWLNRNPQPPLDLSQPIELASKAIWLERPGHSVHFPATVQLCQDAVLLKPTEGPESTVQLRPDQLRKLNLDGSISVTGLPTRYSHLLIARDISGSITLLRYLQQVQPAAILSLKQKRGNQKP